MDSVVDGVDTVDPRFVAKVPPYMDRLTSWGETGRACDARLRRAGYHLRWRDLTYSIQREIRRAGVYPDWVGADEDRRKRWSNSEACMAAFEELPREAPELVRDDSIPEFDGNFIFRCREGLLMKLPDRADIVDELSWWAANIELDLPDVHKAPSWASLNLAIATRRDKNLLAKTWATYIVKRMSPGEKVAKPKVFAEDEAGHAAKEGDVHDEEMMGRLFGGGDDDDDG